MITLFYAAIFQLDPVPYYTTWKKGDNVGVRACARLKV